MRRMGSDTTDGEAERMTELLKARGITTFGQLDNQITDKEFFTLVALAGRDFTGKERMRIRRDLIIKMAEAVASKTFQQLIGKTNIDRTTALCCAKDAADAFGNALLRDLPENDVTVENDLEVVARTGKDPRFSDKVNAAAARESAKWHWATRNTPGGKS